MEKPKNTEEYNIFEINGIKVYLGKNVKAKDDLIKLKLTSFLFLKSIDAQGINVL